MTPRMSPRPLAAISPGGGQASAARPVTAAGTLTRSPAADAPMRGTPPGTLRFGGLAITDRSTAPRYGCKGPGAAEWLASAGLPLPAAPNSWAAVQGGGRVARLGFTEYLVEADARIIAELKARPRAAGVYPVLRQDLALTLAGRQLPELLAQTCNVNFAALDLAHCPVVLTSLAGVGVTILPGERQGLPEYHLWCDGTYGHYLWETLAGIAAELNGLASEAPQ